MYTRDLFKWSRDCAFDKERLRQEAVHMCFLCFKRWIGSGIALMLFGATSGFAQSNADALAWLGRSTDRRGFESSSEIEWRIVNNALCFEGTATPLICLSGKGAGYAVQPAIDMTGRKIVEMRCHNRAKCIMYSRLGGKEPEGREDVEYVGCTVQVQRCIRAISHVLTSIGAKVGSAPKDTF